MATGLYWRAVLVGYYNSGSWQGEMATMGVSGCAADAGGDFPGSILANLPTFNSNPSGDVGDLTDFTVQYGSVGTGDWTKANQDAIAGALRKFANAVKAYQDTTFSWQEVRVSSYDANDDVINGASIYTLKAPVVGSAGGTILDPSTAIAVSFRSGGRGPRARGRMFVPVVAATAVSSGLVATAAKTAIGNAAGDLVGDLQALETPQTIVSRTGKVYSWITRVQVGDAVDNISRRRRRRRELYTSYAIS